MILIISEQNDACTTTVTHWLESFNQAFFRIDKEDIYKIKNISINPQETVFIIENKRGFVLDIGKIKAVWYRRGFLDLYIPPLKEITTDDLRKQIYKYLYEENESMVRFFNFLISEKQHIGKRDSCVVNKLYVLKKAAALGLSIPSTQIVSNPTNMNIKESVITKAIFEGFKPSIENINYTTYTEIVRKEHLQSSFFPFQVSNTFLKRSGY
jgi:hypothetical protein